MKIRGLASHPGIILICLVSLSLSLAGLFVLDDTENLKITNTAPFQISNEAKECQYMKYNIIYYV